MVKIFKSKFLICISLILVVSITDCTNSRYVEKSVSEIINSSVYTTENVVVTGFMSPVLSYTGTYFYISNTPYNLGISKSCVPVFLEVSDNMQSLIYTDKPITVKGELIYNASGFIDNNNNKFNYRIINAKYIQAEVPELEEYCKIADTGMFEDIYMYYALLNSINSNQDNGVISTDEFQNMVLLLAMSDIKDKDLQDIINIEIKLVEQANKQDYTFDLTELKSKLEKYFERYGVSDCEK